MKQVGLVMDNLPISSVTVNTLPVLSHLDVLTELDVLPNMGKLSVVFLKAEQHKIENLVQQIDNYRIFSVKYRTEMDSGSF